MVSGARGFDRQIALDRGLDVLLAFGGKLLLVRLAPRLLAHEIGPQPRDRLLLPARLDLLGRTVARRVICGRVIAEPIGDRLDKAGPFAIAGRVDRVFGRRAHGDDVVAIHLLADEARGDRLLRQRLGCRLQPAAARR